MRRLCTFAVSVLASLFAPSFHNAFAQKTSAPTHPWTVKEIYGGDNLTGEPPSGISWSPDGSRATYLSDDGDVMQIRLPMGS